MQDDGFLNYINDFFNAIDFGMFILKCFYFSIRMINPGSILVPIKPVEGLDRDEVEFLYHMSMFNSLILCIGFLKIMFFLRISEKFGLLVDLVA